MRRRHVARDKAARTIAVYIFAAWCIVPLVWLVSISLRPPVDAFTSNPLSTFHPTLANYFYAFDTGGVAGGLKTSAIVVGITTVIAVGLATPIAYVTTQIWGPSSASSGRVMLYFLSALITPPIGLLFPLYNAFGVAHLIGSVWCIVILYTFFSLPLAVLLMRTYMLGVPHALVEAARVDGGGEWFILRRCIIPIVRGGIIATAVLCVLQQWNEYMFASVLVSSQNGTLPVVIASFLNFEGTQWGPLSAAGVVGALPMVVFALLVQRQLARGLTFGAVK
jgi:ABC-type glycerol-3-phosphate transport system permease component